jgi:hypothetical protein
LKIAGLNRRLKLGPLWLALYHMPVGRLRESFRHGGPWQQRRTARGRREMEIAAAKLPMPTVQDGAPLHVHLLTGAQFWYQTAFCLHTLATQARRPVHPTIYDDGTLTPSHEKSLQRLFPSARFVGQSVTLQQLDRLLPRATFPFLRERWDNYPNIRKLIDPHLGSRGWKLVLDSDLLFFHQPTLLLEWLDAPTRPLHGIDALRSYGYSDALLAQIAEAPLPDRLNVGLCGLKSEELDWSRVENICRQLITKEGTHYFLEQALVAILLAGQSCTVAPAEMYQTLPQLPEALECEAVMHHYVAHSKRWFFQHNWRRAAASCT